MRLRTRVVTVADDVAQYVDAVGPLYPQFDDLWSSVIWTLEHRAHEISEALAGSSHIATVRLSPKLPVVTLVFKLSDETVHITDCEFKFGA